MGANYTHPPAAAHEVLRHSNANGRARRSLDDNPLTERWRCDLQSQRTHNLGQGILRSRFSVYEKHT